MREIDVDGAQRVIDAAIKAAELYNAALRAYFRSEAATTDMLHAVKAGDEFTAEKKQREAVDEYRAYTRDMRQGMRLMTENPVEDAFKKHDG